VATLDLRISRPVDFIESRNKSNVPTVPNSGTQVVHVLMGLAA
jgi:hypothetical protein